MAAKDDAPSTCTRVFGTIAPIASLVAFISTAFFNGLAGQDAESLHWGLFKNTTGDISDLYYIEITPAGWTFSIWGFIYTYQAILIIYWLTLLCRKNPVTSQPLYVSPVFVSPWIGLVYVLNMACNTAWIFLWDRQHLKWAAVVLALIAITLYICLGIGFRSLGCNTHTMLTQNIALEIRLTIGILFNGLAMYATWTTIATLLNLAIVLTYTDASDMKQDVACTVSLSCLAFIVVVYVVLDHVVLERSLRYIFTPYIVLHVALIGSLDKNWDSAKPNSILTAGLLVIGAFATLMKVVMTIYRTKRHPLYPQMTMERL